MTNKTNLRGPRVVSLIQAISEAIRADESDRIEQLQEILPSGSGIDSGTSIDDDESSESKVVLTLGYHHMDENGYYCGWSYWKLSVIPTFSGIDIDIEKTADHCDHFAIDVATGEEYDNEQFSDESTTEYLGDLFHQALTQDIHHYWDVDEERVVYRDPQYDRPEKSENSAP